MLVRMLAVCAALLVGLAPAQAGRVALVIGQNAYPGGSPDLTGLPRLANSVPDAKSIVELLASSGFEVLSCDGKTPGCFDLNRDGLLNALDQLKARAAGADLALIYFAGHGVASDEGNIVTPVDAKVNCETGAISNGVPVEQLLNATEPAKHKFLILDACRDNPLGEICPGLMARSSPSGASRRARCKGCCSSPPRNLGKPRSTAAAPRIRPSPKPCSPASRPTRTSISSR